MQVEEGTHDALYKSVVKFFEENNIPYRRNMVGFASDGASVMFSVNNSVATKFKEDIQHIFTIKCICHSLARAVSYAVQELPHEIGELLSDTFCYLKHSSNRRVALGKIQVLNDIPERQLKKSIKVRWLSLSAAVSRFIEQYDASFKFFEAESKEKNANAKIIFNRLRVRWTIIYLHFLNFVLPMVCKRNEEFQTEKPKIHLLHKKMETLFKRVVSCYLNEDYVDRTDPKFIEFAQITKDNERNWELLHKIDLGPVVAVDLASLPPSISATEINEFRSKCRQLLIILAKEIYKRFPFMERSVKMLKQLGFIEPEILKETRNISKVAHFFEFDVEEFYGEFRKMKKMFKHDMDKDGTIFWQKVRAAKFADGSAEFPLILQIIDRSNVLPHFLANCERKFSQINLNKTKVKNSLSTDTVKGIFYGKRLIKKKSIWHVDYRPMLPLVTEDMY